VPAGWFEVGRAMHRMLAPMGLFGKNPEKQAKADAAQAESERLAGLPTVDLAAEVMPAFGPDGINAKAGHRQGPMEVVSWLLPDAPVKYRQPILGSVIEALGVLEHADLLTRHAVGTSGNASTYNASRLGETALAESTVREQLASAQPGTVL
jgi:hypothetical protein